MTFSQLKRKEVINVCNGGRMGCVCDIIIDINLCRIEAIVVPGPFSFKCLLAPQKNIIIPWNKIRKIGDDVILVDAGEIFPK